MKPSTSKWKRDVLLDTLFQNEPTEKMSDIFPKLIEVESIDIFYKFICMSYLTKMTRTYGAQKGTNIKINWKDIT